MRINSFIFVFLIYLFGIITITPSTQAAQRSEREIQVEFVSVTGISLEALSEGEAGAGYLLYYLPERGVEQPSLVVHLEKEAAAKRAIANIYDALSSDTNLVGAGLAPAPQLDESLTARITIEALDGWWVRDGLVNYNLDIQINGPMFAMWGAAYEPKFGGDGWSVEVQMAPERPTVSIQVRDPTQTGLPQWELRQLLPAFVGRGYYRTNYAERKCETPTEIDLGPSPLWPYISEPIILSEEENGFEQPVAYFHPPIVVDWEAGQITHFSEFVTVRNQNCSYSFYSINSLRPDDLNQANFETPLGAEGGLWNLGKGEVIRLHNLDGDLYLDGWTREPIVGAGLAPAPAGLAPAAAPAAAAPAAPAPAGLAPAAAPAAPAPVQIEEALYSLEGYLLYGGDGEVVIRKSGHEPSLGELLPPSDQASWQAFGEEVGAREVQEESISLKKWFDTFRGATVRITKGQLSEVRAKAKGFRFVLELQEGFEIRGNQHLFDANDLEAGQYEISYDGEWHISPLTPPALSIDVEFREPEHDDQEPLLTLVQVSNSGSEEAKGLTFIAEASLEGAEANDSRNIQLTNQPLDVLDSTQLILNWQPDSAGAWTLNFSLLDANKNVITETSYPITIKEEQPNQATVLAVSTNNGPRLLSYLLILAFGLLIGLIWHRQDPLS